MKKLIAAVALLSLPLGSIAADSQDTMFYTEAAQGGMNEVELGKLAADKGSTTSVKSFGKQMVTDHTMANKELMAIAKQKSVMLSTEPNAEGKATKKTLQGLTGAAFDRAYIESQVKDHDKTIALLERQISSGKDADAKAWATKTLPVVQQHAAMVKKMAEGSHQAH